MKHLHHIERKELLGSNLLNEVLLISGWLAIVSALLYALSQAILLNGG